MMLLPGETKSFDGFEIGQSIVVDGYTFTIVGLTVSNKKDDYGKTHGSWLSHVRYMSSRNNDPTAYCFRDTWERWRDTGTYYKKGNVLHGVLL